jgi:hypothetical protein
MSVTRSDNPRQSSLSGGCNVPKKQVQEDAFAVSAPTSSSSSTAPAAPAAPAAPRKKGKERRLATRFPLNSHAELIRVPSSSRTAPIKVKVKDISATGVGITYTEPLPIGEKYVVKEPTISRRKSVLFTVVRADQIGENNYSIGLHDSHLIGKDYKVHSKKHGRVAAMATLLILALIMGGLFAVWTLI